MGTEMTKPSNNALAAAQALKGKLAKVAANIPANGSSQYLRMLQDGNWVFGAENTEIAKGKDELAVNPLSIKQGFVCWTDYGKDDKRANEVLDEKMYPLGADVPLKSEMPEQAFPWSEQYSFELRIMTGKHKGKQMLYKSTSVGGLNMIKAIIDQIMAQLDSDEPEYMVPVVTLDVDSYQHKKWGKTYTPEMNIVDWVTMDDPTMTAASTLDEKPAEPEPEEVEEEKPTRRRARAAEPEPEEEEEEEKDEAPASPRRRARKPEPEEVEEAEEAEEVEETKPVRRRRR